MKEKKARGGSSLHSYPSLRNLRIADLELFVSAAKLKNLGKAASLHHLSQSAASSAIQRVENAFSLSLCLHERRHFRLTSEGRALLARSEPWLFHLKEIALDQGALPLRLATTHAIARVSVPPILSIETIELKLMRPDIAYGSVLRDEADIALVLDNAPWEGVTATEIAKGHFQLFSKEMDAPPEPVLLPEDQIEALTFQQRWQQTYHTPLPIKARLPSWSLIADICSCSKEIGFLPDFLGKQANLHPISYQPTSSRYRILALYRNMSPSFQKRLDALLLSWKTVFK